MNKLSKLKDYGAATKLTTINWWQSASRLLIRRVVIVCAVALVVTNASASPNVLVNGDFEGTSSNPAPTTFANNIGWSILPWVIGTSGQQSNVVTVLADGTYHYLAGPQKDASSATGAVPRHYLDIANGHNDIYQPFTAPCDGKVEFGGWFSSRSADDGTAYAGTGSIRLVQGTGTGGAPVGTTSTVNLPAGGNAHTDPWKLVSSPPVSITAGTTYSFVVTMDDNVNFDEAYVTYKTDCNTQGGSGCAQVTGEAHCLPGGGYSYAFTATNSTGSDMSQILLTPLPGSTFTLSPQLFNLSSPLHNGQSTTLTLTIGNAKPGDKVCFFVSLMSDKAACCNVQVCLTLPDCGGGVNPTNYANPTRPSPRGRRRP